MPCSSRSGSTRHAAVRAAQGGQRLGEPWPGHGRAPVAVGLRGSVVAGEAGARQEPHGLAERQALRRGAALDRLELLERPAQPLVVDLDPFAANEGEPVGLRQQALDLGLRERLAVERHLHAEVEQRVESELRGRIAADRRLHLRPRRAVHAPARRHAHDHAGGFERGHVLEELQRLLRPPAQRVEDLAGVDHGLEPAAVLGGALDRHQQRQQALAVLRAGIVLQGLAERQMLRLAFAPRAASCRSPGTRRALLVPSVLGQIEMHAPDQVPGGMAALEKVLDGKLRLREFGVEGGVRLRPEIGEHVRRQVFRAGHRRNRRGDRHQFVVGRRSDRRLRALSVDVRQRAQRRHVARAEIAPVGQHRRHGRPDLVRAEPQQPMPGPARERLLEPRPQLGRHFRRVRGLAQRQRAMRRENRREHHDGARLIIGAGLSAKGSIGRPLFDDGLLWQG